MNNTQPLKILIVDDEEGITSFFKKHFSFKGFSVFAALDGKTALELFKKEHPQLCFIDIWLTGGTHEGIEILRSIKDIAKDTYCIMLGPCLDEENTAKQAKELKALHFINKPFGMEELDQFVEEVEDLINKKNAVRL